MQKTFIKYLLLAIFICSSFTLSANAITQQDFINQHLKDRKLDNIEGIWITSSGRVYGFYKQGNQYVNKIISEGKRFRSGQIIGYLNKGSENVFYGKEDIDFNSRIGMMQKTKTCNWDDLADNPRVIETKQIIKTLGEI